MTHLLGRYGQRRGRWGATGLEASALGGGPWSSIGGAHVVTSLLTLQVASTLSSEGPSGSHRVAAEVCRALCAKDAHPAGWPEPPTGTAAGRWVPPAEAKPDCPKPGGGAQDHSLRAAPYSGGRKCLCLAGLTVGLPRGAGMQGTTAGRRCSGGRCYAVRGHRLGPAPRTPGSCPSGLPATQVAEPEALATTGLGGGSLSRPLCPRP